VDNAASPLSAAACQRRAGALIGATTVQSQSRACVIRAAAHADARSRSGRNSACFTLAVELTIQVEDAELPATLTLPSGTCRAGVVVLHGAEAGERSYFLYEHLAELLARHDVAVLRYDRRRTPDGQDVPLQTQAADALAATKQLQDVVGGPVGLWGYSQGAWGATLAAATDPDPVAFLICVSGCGVSPAHQMRVGCANQLRKHGFTELQVQELVATRLAVEGFLRGGQGR